MIGISEKENKREEYLNAIKKRAKEMPELGRIIEETKSHRVELSKEAEPDKNKQKKQTQ